eukprot:1174263-Prorocentrum_minimum.AAC.1
MEDFQDTSRKKRAGGAPVQKPCKRARAFANRIGVPFNDDIQCRNCKNGPQNKKACRGEYGALRRAVMRTRDEVRTSYLLCFAFRALQPPANNHMGNQRTYAGR